MSRASLVLVAMALINSCRPAARSELPSPNAADPGSSDGGADAGIASLPPGSTTGASVPDPVTLADMGMPAPIPPVPRGDVGCGTWSLEQPLPQSRSLRGAWAASSDDVWAVGDQGTILHWNG